MSMVYLHAVGVARLCPLNMEQANPIGIVRIAFRGVLKA